MKYQKLSDWALDLSKKDNGALIGIGVNDKKLSKVRNILKDGINTRCKLVIENLRKNDKYKQEIEDYIKQLKFWGLTYSEVDELMVPLHNRPNENYKK